MHKENGGGGVRRGHGTAGVRGLNKEESIPGNKCAHGARERVREGCPKCVCSKGPEVFRREMLGGGKGRASESGAHRAMERGRKSSVCEGNRAEGLAGRKPRPSVQDSERANLCKIVAQGGERGKQACKGACKRLGAAVCAGDRGRRENRGAWRWGKGC